MTVPLSVCFPVCPPLCQSVRPHPMLCKPYLSVCLPVRPFLSVSVLAWCCANPICLSARLSNRSSVRPSVRLSAHPLLCPSSPGAVHALLLRRALEGADLVGVLVDLASEAVVRERQEGALWAVVIAQLAIDVVEFALQLRQRAVLPAHGRVLGFRANPTKARRAPCAWAGARV
jgi:hypothetical protein